jgi:hypothetical protein
MPSIDPALAPFIEAASAGVHTVLDCADRLVGPEDSARHLHAVALHATVTELLSGCVLLAMHEHATGIPILLRSMYEALVDLDNLLRDRDYMEQIEAANLSQVVKLLRAAKSNPLLRGIDQSHGVRLPEFEARLEALKKSKRRPLHIEDRCRKVNRLNEYESLYAVFSLDVHSNSAALGDRHISESDDGTTQIAFFGVMDPKITASRLDHGLRLLIDSARMIHDAFQTGAPEIRELHAQFERERLPRLMRVGLLPD